MHYRRWSRHKSPFVKKKRQGELLSWIRDHTSFEGDECLTWPFGRNAAGYGEVRYAGSQHLASRVMCLLAHGQAPEAGMQAAHSCGRGHEACVNPKHLRWATPIENAADKVAHGTAGFGATNSMAKLSPMAVAEIRQLAGMPGARQRKIAERFGVTQQTVSDIKIGRRWPSPSIINARY